MRPIDSLITTGVAAAIALLLVIVVFSGRLPAELRRRLELVMIAAALPSGVAFALWRGFEAGRAGDRLAVLGYVILAGVYAIVGWRWMCGRLGANGSR
jgi:hypothetical protein